MSKKIKLDLDDEEIDYLLLFTAEVVDRSREILNECAEIDPSLRKEMENSTKVLSRLHTLVLKAADMTEEDCPNQDFVEGCIVCGAKLLN